MRFEYSRPRGVTFRVGTEGDVRIYDAAESLIGYHPVSAIRGVQKLPDRSVVVDVWSHAQAAS